MKLLEEASENAIKVVAYNKAYYAQLTTIDTKTMRICSKFMSSQEMDPEMGPEERELLAEELLRLQQARSKVVTKLFELNLI